MIFCRVLQKQPFSVQRSSIFPWSPPSQQRRSAHTVETTISMLASPSFLKPKTMFFYRVLQKQPFSVQRSPIFPWRPPSQQRRKNHDFLDVSWLRCQWLEFQICMNIALLCKMVRIPFLFPERSFQLLIPPTKRLALIWTKKSLFEDFYIKIFNWKRKQSNSHFQVRCAWQTTTNIALLCKIFKVCSVSGVAWKHAMFAKLCHLLCEWCRWKICLVSKKKCHVSGFDPYPHLLCECCRLKICLVSKKMPC